MAVFPFAIARRESRAPVHRKLVALSTRLSAGLASWPIAAAAQTAGPTPQLWAIHAQATSIWMLQPAFRSSYQGPQSLSPAANGRETVDTTLYFGFRPWRGAEIWINPEMDQGFGLSDVTGAAGYIDAESSKVGELCPYYQMPRGFLRQTIDLGGATQAVAPDLNQLGGRQTANRLVLTIGKFAVTDIFDNNDDAHDPRNDFLNWSIVDMGAFDYAANAWGYTYGAAAEWYQGRWTARVGAFDLSSVPNGEKLDNRFGQQMQYVAELEERHTLWGQPGAIRVLYWLSRGMLGSYGDALAEAAATGAVPSTANVRRERSKDGIGVNIQQQITPALGIFARASANNGGVEADEYTDISQSVSAGLSVTGQGWGRPGDMFGLAGAVNTISHEAKEYFAAGGLGILIGDGQLPEAGPEQIIETYYSVPVTRYAHLTADYQFLNNPAYNRQRGPVSVFLLRLHAQF